MHEDKLPNEYIEIRALLPNESSKVHFSTKVDSAAEFCLKWSERRNVYYGILPRTRQEGTNDAVERAYWVWADLDGTADEDDYRKRYPFRPHVVISSGSGFHLYWRIEPTEDLGEVREASNRIADTVGGDHVGDPARILRVPGTYNYKGEEPVEVTTLDYHEGPRYTLHDLIAATKLSNKIRYKIATGDRRGYRSRSERDFAVAGALLRSGLGEETIVHIFENQPVGDKHRELNDGKYLDRTIKKMRDRVKDTGSVVIKDSSGVVQAQQVEISKPTFVEIEDAYHTVGKDGALRRISTFVFKPEVILEGDISEGEQDTLLGTVHASGYEWYGVTLTKDAFSRVDRMLKELPVAAWQWLGTDRDVRKLLPYLMEELRLRGLPRRVATPIIGTHKGVFVGPEETVTVEGVLTPDQSKIVWLPTKRERPRVKYVWPDEADYVELLENFVTYFFEINEPTVVWTCLGWYVAALFKQSLEDRNIRYPILNLFGTRGSGKTATIVEVMQPFIGYEDPRAYDANTTRFALLSLLGSTNAVPVSLKEYRRKALKYKADQLLRMLLQAYDHGFDIRGRQDQTTQTYTLSAPVTIDGEDAMSDPAILERVIQVHMHPETIREDTNAYFSFEQLSTLPLVNLAGRLVSWSLSYELQFEAALAKTKELFSQPLPTRVRRNVAVTLAGMWAFRDFCEFYSVPVPALDDTVLELVLGPTLGNVVNLQTGRTELLGDEGTDHV
jgi:hypothetical protein